MTKKAEERAAIQAAICDRIAQGESLRKISETKGMPAASTIWKWLAEDAAFSEQYARAREEQADYYADEIVSLADGALGLPSEGVQAVRLAVDARKWVASKLKPKKYGDRTELTGPGGGPIQQVVAVEWNVIRPEAVPQRR